MNLPRHTLGTNNGTVRRLCLLALGFAIAAGVLVVARLDPLSAPARTLRAAARAVAPESSAGDEPGAPVPDRASADAHRLARAAESQVGITTIYDPAYVELDYPGGDVPLERGVCTDVVVRAFRAVGIDLQAKVHEDMLDDFGAYPKRWGLTEPDPNIDHRRVPNLQTYFARTGSELPVTDDPADYQPGDVVTWKVAGRPHTGIMSTVRSDDGARWLVAHNIGRGTEISDTLFAYEITGHYRPR